MDRSNRAIEDLCTSYHAYMTAIAAKDNTGIMVWAQCLISDQLATGVNIVPIERLQDTVSIRLRMSEETS